MWEKANQTVSATKNGGDIINMTEAAKNQDPTSLWDSCLFASVIGT